MVRATPAMWHPVTARHQPWLPPPAATAAMGRALVAVRRHPAAAAAAATDHRLRAVDTAAQAAVLRLVR